VSDDAERDARAYLLDLGIGAELIDTTTPDEWYLLVQQQLNFGGPPTLTARDVADRVGMDVAAIRRLWQINGLGDPGEEARAFYDADLPLFEMYKAGVAVFGEEMIDRFSRALGSAARSLSDATTALFGDVLGPSLVDVASLKGHLELAVLGGDLNRRLPDEVIRPLYFHHAETSQRFSYAAGAWGSSQLDLAVGFCDLVGSTELATGPRAAEFGRAVMRFEEAAHDAASSRGGRVIKLIGDEVMLAGLDVATVEAAFEELLRWVADDDVLVAARAGIAFGTVASRGGDLYGPTVHLAARLASMAQPGHVLVADDAGEPVAVRGFERPVLVRRVGGPG
jgi:adenylate cyclase